ncbi:MAG: hypothetical protein NWE92_07650 [Candidatus Bathyarchaeota archaeon]|nr:hypothetical protein [Candidatus Bathyarchaeota archaeon]
MSQTEDPAVTIMRLLRNNLHVVKDNGSLATVTVSGEWQNSDALRSGDGQVTVALADCLDKKIDLTGKIRQRTAALRVNVWAADMLNAAEGGKSLRAKLVDEVNRVICENRNKPHETLYSFVGAGVGKEGSKAFYGDTENPPTSGWAELSDSEYQELWYSDDSRYQISISEADKSAVLLLGFKIDSAPDTVKQLVLSFEGYGTAPGGDGFVVQVWNNAAEAWQHNQTSAATAADSSVTVAVQADLPDLIDSDGHVWLLVATVHASDGQTAASLFCDYASCTAQVNGVTYCDVAGYRNLDRVDLKPPIYRTEFSVKSWFIKNIGV